MKESGRKQNVVVRIGTRGSALALWQTNHIKNLLQKKHPHCHTEIDVIKTRGDELLDKSLPSIGGKGLFTAELEKALADGRIDLAVHSAKDLPTEFPRGLTIGAVVERANPADVLVSRRAQGLETLPRGAAVGTSSPRRAAQLLLARPDLEIKDIRGNVDTRVAKALDAVGGYDAIVLAHAGLDRLGRLDAATQVLSFEVMLPAPGQGALAVQCRDDETSLDILRSINDPASELAVAAERAFLSGLGGGCALPICCLGECRNGELRIRGRVLTPDGSDHIDVEINGRVGTVDDGRMMGEGLAAMAVKRGAADLLENRK